MNLVGQHINPILPSDQLQEDFKILLEHLEKYHPDIDLYTPKTTFDSIANSIQNSLDKPMTELQFYRKVLPLICAIRNGHTDLYPSEFYMKHLSEDEKRFSLVFYYYKDSLFLLKNGSDEYNIKEGSLITKINGENAIDLIKQMVRLNSVDGYHTGISFSRMSQRFITYYSLLKGTPKEFNVDYIDSFGKEQTSTIKAIPLKEIRENFDKRYSNKSTKAKQEYYLEFENENTAVLKINTFQSEKEFAFYNFLKKAFNEIDAKNIDNLIIDVRGNGGGYPESAMQLLSYLVTEKVRTTKTAYALVENLTEPNHFVKDGFYKHFNRKNLKQEGKYFHTNDVKRAIIKPKNPSFNGKLYILLDDRSASATAEFLGLAYSYCDATFIGRESGSNPVTQVATDIVSLILPNSKLKVRFPLIKTETNVNIKNEGYGLIPNYSIQPTPEEILNRKDVDMEKAMELILKEERPN